MKTKRIELYFRMVESIRYDNDNGGAYAYIQYMAYTRELLVMLRPLKSVERQLETIEGINWLFNEHLAFKFTPRHKLIFEEKMHETRGLFDIIRTCVKETEYSTLTGYRRLHAQAA